MTEFTFLHASDLHLGKRFGFLPEDARAGPIQARAEILGRLAAAAHQRGAAHILLAGDTFDTETPAPATLRQALSVMAEHDDLTWWILPGNHDSLAAEALWEEAARRAAPNTRILDRAAPVEIAPAVVLLPAPMTRRFPGHDLTAWMDAAETAPGTIRLGLAHGSAASFGDTPAPDAIAPDRDRRAGLAYLALGDWHGTRAITPRIWYSGTPEPDSFRHGMPGRCLCVTLRGPEAPPEVQEIETGRYLWLAPEMLLSPQEDAAAALRALLPGSAARRRDTLVRLRPEGRTTLEARAALEAEIAALAPDFLHVEHDLSRLVAEVAPDDLDQIASGGALREAAETLLAGATRSDLPEAERARDRAALARLYALSREITP